MDSYLKKEQIGTFFVLVGVTQGGFGDAGGAQGCPPQKVYVPSPPKKKPVQTIQRWSPYFTVHIVLPYHTVPYGTSHINDCQGTVK
jgi:hypothetical protein